MHERADTQARKHNVHKWGIKKLLKIHNFHGFNILMKIINISEIYFFVVLPKSSLKRIGNLNFWASFIEEIHQIWYPTNNNQSKVVYNRTKLEHLKAYHRLYLISS